MTAPQLLTGSARALLAVGLRTRAASVSTLAELARRTPDDIQNDLELLNSLGYLTRSGEAIWYPNPEAVVTAHAERMLSETSALIDQQLSTTRDLLHSLPTLLSQWHSGVPATDLDRAEVVHDGHAAIDLWFAHRAAQKVSQTCAVMPDSRPTFDADEGLRQRWYDSFSSRPDSLRLILSAADMAHPGAAETVDRYLADGYEVRMMQQPPSWFWVIDDSLAAVPLEWGEKWPTSAVIIRSKAMIAVVQSVFERLWEEAVPPHSGEAAWDSLVALMSQGATLESASRTLGISARTGRRRLADAMDHFGVRGQVALGAAWKLAQMRTHG